MNTLSYSLFLTLSTIVGLSLIHLEKCVFQRCFKFVGRRCLPLKAHADMLNHNSILSFNQSAHWICLGYAHWSIKVIPLEKKNTTDLSSMRMWKNPPNLHININHLSNGLACRWMWNGQLLCKNTEFLYHLFRTNSIVFELVVRFNSPDRFFMSL